MRIQKEMVVAFIDILGTKNRSIEEAEKIYLMFQSFIQRNEDRQHNFSHKSYSRKSWFFSDCAFLVYYQKEGLPKVSIMEIVRPMLINLSIELLKIWDEGFLVRGGIAAGEGCIHLDEPIFCGAPFNEAASFDRKDMPPCIFLSRDLAEQFEHEYREGEKIIRSNANELESMFLNFPEYILCDEDRYFLNALWYLEDTRISTAVEDRMISPAQFVKKQGLYFQEQIALARIKKNESVAQKWLWMRYYFFNRLCPFDDPVLQMQWGWSDDDSRTTLINTHSHCIDAPPDLSSFIHESSDDETENTNPKSIEKPLNPSCFIQEPIDRDAAADNPPSSIPQYLISEGHPPEESYFDYYVIRMKPSLAIIGYNHNPEEIGCFIPIPLLILSETNLRQEEANEEIRVKIMNECWAALNEWMESSK